MTTNISRAKSTDVLYLCDGKEILVDLKTFLQDKPFDEFIRLHKNEHDAIPINKTFAHFNLQQSLHKIGNKYALPLIVRNGYMTKTKEVFPLLSFENCLIAECLDVQEKVAYSDIHQRILASSLIGLQSVIELKEFIKQKYSTSMPDLTDKELEKLGVGITTLKVI